MPKIVMMLNGQDFFSIFLNELNIQNNSIFMKQIFCNIINVFTVTFDKFNVSLWKKKKKKKKLL